MMTECKYCKKTFNHSGHLTRHIRTHTREKPYECSYCKKRFSDSSTLTVHTRIHTGERPFSCKFCKKTFSRSDSLRVHVRTHTGEKKFECHHCRKTFSRSGNLTVHLRTHMSLSANDPCNTGTNGTFECHRCNKSFTQMHDLNRHLKTHHNHERVDNPLFQAICKTEPSDARSKSSCCGNNFQQHPYATANGNICCKPNNMPFGFDQCSTGNKLTNYINGQPLDKSCNGTIATNLEGSKELPISVGGHHGNHHCNLPATNGHYTQLLVQNENKPFDCHGFEKSHACQLQRHLQRSLDAGVDSVMAAPSSCDNQNILYMNPGFHGHTGDKSRRCTLCEKSVFHMCQLNGGNYCIPFSGSYNSLTNVTNIPANPMCSSAADFNRNQACTYIDSRSLPTQQHFGGCNHCKNPSHTNSSTDVKPTTFGSQIYIKPDLNSNPSADPLRNSCAYLNGKSHSGETHYGCENCKTTNHAAKDDKNVSAASSGSSNQNENNKKPCPTNSANPLQNQSCSFSGGNHLHMKDHQLFGCKQCDVRGFGQPFTMNYNSQHELDIKPNLSIGNLDPNLQSNHYYSSMRTNPTDKQLSCLKPYGQNPADRKPDLSVSNVTHPPNSFFGLLQSLPEPDVFECDNNGEKPFVPLGGFLNPQGSSQKSCLFSSLSCNNPEMLDIKPNITSLHDHYHQALTHFSQADAFSKSDFSTCFSTAQTTLEPSLYDANAAGMSGNVNMGGGVTSGASGMCMKSEPFFCSGSGENQTQPPFSYHSLEQPDIKPDLSLLWF